MMPGPPHRLRFSGYAPRGTIFTEAAEQFKSLVEDGSGGRIAVELTPNVLELGQTTDRLIRMVDGGQLEGCYMSTSVPPFNRLSARLGVFDLPFLISSRAQAFAVLDGELGAAMTHEVEAGSNLKCLGYWENGFRHVTNGRRPARRPEDLAGLRIRAQPNPLHERAFRLLGMEPVAMDVAELLPALREGRVDGQENPLENTWTLGIFPFTRYVTMTSHLYGVRGMYLHRPWLERLPEDLQAVLLEAGRRTTAFQRARAERRDEEIRALMEQAGAEFADLTAEEREAFRERVRPLHEELAERLGRELLDRVAAAG